MNGRSITLFQLLGFKVRVDFSWLFLAVLVTWSLALGAFPLWYEGLAPATYWAMGVAGMIGLVFSLVFHELSHSLVARRYGLPIKGITLFIFGGVAEMSDEPPSAQAEFAVAIAGPIMSFAIGGVCGIATLFGPGVGLPVEATLVIGYLALLNVLLALFNLVPAFPLDGGRMLRSALWYWKGDLRYATRVTSAIGGGFGILLIILGVVGVLSGNVFALWYVLIGLFVRNAAQMSYQQLLLRRALEGETVERFMHRDPITVPRAISVTELVEGYVYRHHHKMFPVVDDDRLVGCVTTRQIQQLPRDEWNRTTVGALAQSCSADNSVPPDEDAMKALSLMSKNGLSRVLVVDQERLVGILSLKDLLDFLSLKIELERG